MIQKKKLSIFFFPFEKVETLETWNFAEKLWLIIVLNICLKSFTIERFFWLWFEAFIFYK